jgi:hypothetical protein
LHKFKNGLAPVLDALACPQVPDIVRLREGMLDHEIERRMEELNNKVLSLNSNVVPLKRA